MSVGLDPGPEGGRGYSSSLKKRHSKKWDPTSFRKSRPDLSPLILLLVLY